MTKLNLVKISVLSFSLLILSVSAQPATYPADVAGIKILKTSFPNLGINSTMGLLPADPCLPEPYPWVTCSSDDTPRVTAINCGDKQLLGLLVDFSPMDALEVIDFSNNILMQEFPDFFTKFPNLRVLNLADNGLTGTVPTSLQKNKNLNLTVTGNLFLCYSDNEKCKPNELIDLPPGTPGMGKPENEGNRRNSLQIMLGTVISFFVMFWVVA